MLAFAIFLTVCCVGVLYMLGFLLAIESDIRRTVRNRSNAKIERLSARHAQSGAQVPAVSSVLTLVHSNPFRRTATVPSSSATTFARSENKSQFREA